MTGTYDHTAAVEAEGIRRAEDLFRFVGATWIWREDVEFQTTRGDALIVRRGREMSLEVKTEAEDQYGRFFLEEWSNLSFNHHHKAGWMRTLNTDRLLYQFLDTGQMFLLDFWRLFRWAYEPLPNEVLHRIERYPLRPQKRHSQRNATWGRCVPFADIFAGPGFVGVFRWGPHGIRQETWT